MLVALFGLASISILLVFILAVLTLAARVIFS